MRKFLNLAVVMLLFLSLVSCHAFFKWRPVRDGVEFEGDSVVRIERVEIRVQDFGVWDSWGNPAFTLRIKNGGDSVVEIDLADCCLNIGERLAAPYPKESIKLYKLDAGEKLKVEIVFDGRLELALREDPEREDYRVVPNTLTLILPPMIVGELQHVLPSMTFTNPDP